VIYEIRLSRPARRALANELPEAVATACLEFIYRSLATEPYRVGNPLRPPATPHYAARRGQFRVIYDIRQEEVVVEEITIMHRRDVYRTTS
jgi:mRNA interferase RelE/StbE